MPSHSRTSSHYLPVEPFLARTVEWLAKQQNSHQQETNLKGRPKPEHARLSPREYLCLRAEVSMAWMQKFLYGRLQSIHFDVADRLLCAMNIAHEWLTDPEFKELYAGIDFKKLDKVKPCSVRRHNGGHTASWNTVLAHSLREAGKSYAEIAEEVGAPNGNAVCKLLGRRGAVEKNQLGLPARARRIDYAETLRLSEDGWSHEQIAEKFGVKPSSIKQALWRMKKGLAKAA